MSILVHPGFADPDLLQHLSACDDATLDPWPFGVIGFDADGRVCRYNAWESQAAGLSAARVLGQPLFTVVAPCMNNPLVAQRFAQAAAAGQALDHPQPYVLTLRMRPTPVTLRLLAPAGAGLRYVLIQRPAA